MRLSGSATVPLEIAEVWRRLDDPAELLRCTPGLVRLDPTSPDHYELALELRLPALRGRFAGTVDVCERTAPERMRLALSGKGAPGFVEGEATLQLVDAGLATHVKWAAQVQVGGTIARLGQRMLSGVVLEMAAEFFSNLGNTDAASAPRAPAAGGPGRPAGLRAILRLLWRALRKRLGLSGSR
ncbi:MAG: CoxG family protein [Myxococcota bacterium]